MNNILTSERVEKIFMDCLFKNEEVIDGKPIFEPVKAEGIMTNIGFHPERLQSHKEEIIEMLNELPENFHVKTGGGWSFLFACNDKHGELWTGLHERMEQLFQLGIGIGKVSYLMPRHMWEVLPGKMPYFVISE